MLYFLAVNILKLYRSNEIGLRIPTWVSPEWKQLILDCCSIAAGKVRDLSKLMSLSFTVSEEIGALS